LRQWDLPDSKLLRRLLYVPWCTGRNETLDWHCLSASHAAEENFLAMKKIYSLVADRLIDIECLLRFRPSITLMILMKFYYVCLISDIKEGTNN